MVSETITGENNLTILCSMGKWKNKDILVTHQTNECPIRDHALEVVHHYDNEDNHYCPTMLLTCSYCGGIADEPEPFECNKWGENQ